MAIVPRRTERQVADAQLRPNTSEARTATTPEAFGSIGARQVQAGGELLQKAAEAEDKLLRERYTSRLLAQVTEFETESLQDLNVLARDSAPDAPLVKNAMEQFKEKAGKLVETQPNFLQSEARQRLLVTQAKTARSAIALENTRVQNEITRNAEIFSNGIVNDVRFNGKNEELAMQQIDAFLERGVPESRREAEAFIMKQKVRQATLASAVEADPRAAMARIREGQFNDVDSTVLERQFSRASAAYVAQQKAAMKLQNEAFEERFDDPKGAAVKLMQSRGVIEPTQVQLDAAQDELGVSPYARRLLTKAQAQPVADEFANVQTVDEFFARKEAYVAEISQQGLDPEKAIQDVEELADMPPALAAIFDVDPLKVDTRYVGAGIQLLRDDKAGQKALRNIADRNPLTASVRQNKAKEVVLDLIAPQVQVMYQAGMSTIDIEAAAAAQRDMGLIIFDQAEGAGKDGETEVKRVFNSLSRQRVTHLDNNDAYFLPFDISSRETESNLRAYRRRIAREQPDLFVPTTYPSEEVYRTDLERNAGWFMNDNQSLVLRNNGQPVYTRNENGGLSAIVLPFDKISQLEADLLIRREAVAGDNAETQAEEDLLLYQGYPGLDILRGGM